MVELGFLTETTYFGNTLGQYIFFIIVVIGSYLVAKTLYYFFKHEARRLTAKTSTHLDDLLIDIVEEPLVIALVIIGLHFGFDYLSFDPGISGFISTVLSILVSLTVLWFVVRIADAIVVEVLTPKDEEGSRLSKGMVPLVKKVAKAFILVFGIITIASNYGYDITALITAMGIGGLAIALAAKDTLGNLFGGLSLFTDRPFAIGDRVKIGDIYGDVVDVGIRSCKIQTLDNTIVTIPNSKVAESVVENYIKPDLTLKQSFNMGLTYDTKPEKIEEAVGIIKKAIQTTEGVAKKEPLIWFTEFKDFSLNLMCIYWIKSLDYWGTTKHDINLKILRGLNKAKIGIAYPTQTVHVEK